MHLSLKMLCGMARKGQCRQVSIKAIGSSSFTCQLVSVSKFFLLEQAPLNPGPTELGYALLLQTV